MGTLVTRASDGAHLRWRDEDGVIHAVEGSVLVNEDPRTFAEWTRSGIADVFPEESWASEDELGCEQCARIESGFAKSGEKRTLGRLMEFQEQMRGVLDR